MTELCERFGISRKTGYKWLARSHEQGLDGLRERSRAPKHHPNQIAQDLVSLIIQARDKHPTWGAAKLRDWLHSHHEEVCEHLPSASTIGAILSREGKIQPRPKRRCWPQ